MSNEIIEAAKEYAKSGGVDVPVVNAPPEIYLPKGATRGARRRSKVALNIIGRSGCGKSFCAVNQFVTDSGYGPNEILIAMAEDSTASYGDDTVIPKLAIEDVNSFTDVSDLVADLAKAARAGKRLPKLFVLDDLSILSQKLRRHYDAEPLTNDAGMRDTRSEFRVKGYSLLDALIDIRTELPIDSVTLVRSHEGPFNAAPEIALEGNIAPKNLTGMSSITLYMKADSPKYELPAYLSAYNRGVLFQPHRTLGATKEEIEAAIAAMKAGNEKPNLDLTVINRYFVTMNTGEIEAKGHHTLRLKEKAYLPDVFRKIHGEKPLYL